MKKELYTYDLRVIVEKSTVAFFHAMKRRGDTKKSLTFRFRKDTLVFPAKQ